MDHQHVEALVRAVGPDRFASYLAAAADDRELACRLYVWDRDLSAALLADIAIVEIALRNAINHQLVAAHGPEWYTQDIGLDARSRNSLTTAWRRLTKSGRRVPGKVIAQLMFGFWADLLDAGGEIGDAPQSSKADYEQMWRAGLHRAFPGGRTEAAMLGEQFTRSWTHSIASTVHAVRNRCAHHEPLIRGIPLPGQDRRITVQDGYDACVLLLRTIDRNLASWLESSSSVPDTLGTRPTS
ncbi:hypothetical protein [Isoptericola sp. NPDC056605]|uniref:hypothetical protein n=1 Tax=Isoptericola sp. NPDC056605 TaxID=3345876 RepID=UPI0036AC7F44